MGCTLIVCISRGSCNKKAQSGWLKTTEMSSLTELETTGLKSECSQGQAASQAVSLPAPGSPKLSWACGGTTESQPSSVHGPLLPVSSHHVPSAYVSMQMSSPQDTCYTRLGAHPAPV